MTNPNLNVLDALLLAQAISAMADPDGSLIMIRTSEHRKPTFRYAGNFTPVAAPTDAIMIQGSASKTLRVKRIALGGLATTAGSMATTLVRRTAQFTTQGSAVFTSITAGKHDTTDSTPTGVVATIGTANITSVGASAGNIAQGRIWLPLVTGNPSPLDWSFATRQDKPVILRGVTDFLFVNFNAAALPAGGTVDFEIEIEEDAS